MGKTALNKFDGQTMKRTDIVTSVKQYYNTITDRDIIVNIFDFLKK